MKELIEELNRLKGELQKQWQIKRDDRDKDLINTLKGQIAEQKRKIKEMAKEKGSTQTEAKTETEG